MGPLVVAGVSVSRRGLKDLRALGVRDSKTLSAAQREALYPEILRVAERVQWVGIQPGEIDEVVTKGKRLRKLNYLEAVYFGRVIDELGAARVTVDASDVVPTRFAEDIMANMRSPCRVLAYHKADRDYPAVSAASIIAKVQRDSAVGVLRDAHGDFGSGYPSDPQTRSFFMQRLKTGDALPPYVRKSWKTWLNLRQSLLDAF